MVKALGAFIFVGIMLAFLIFSTPVTRLGSGFLIGDGQHVFTYHDLVKEAEVLNVKFPNEDDIEANVVFSDPASNLAILKLKEVPKVKALPLVLSASGLSLRNESVFTLGYPWTNTMEDLWKFRQHWRVEKNRNLSKAAIKAHGYICQGCGFNFEEKYGEIGKDFIEAHHLVPISLFKRPVVKLDPKLDFAVLCSNCHRMIHKTEKPDDVKAFKSIINSVGPEE